MWLRCLQSEHQDGGSVWCKYPSDSERGERHCWWQMGFFKKLLIHWYFHTGTTSRCVYVFGSNIKNHLTLGKLTVTFFLLLETVHRAFCPLGTAERMPVSVWTFFNGHASACSACHSLCWEGGQLQSAISPGRARPPGPWSEQVGLCSTPPDPDTICLRRLPLAGRCRWPELKSGATTISSFPQQSLTDTTAHFLHSIY